MMKKYRFPVVSLFILMLIVVVFAGLVPQVHAQSDDGWTEPVNLSNSGSSTNPSIVIDTQGMIHIFWVDEFDGYKYANSVDGVDWTLPKTVSVPFSTDTESEAQPVFLAGNDETIHILWRDEDGILQYRRVSSSRLGEPSSWTGALRLADSAVHFSAIVDSQGTLHVGYLNNVSTVTAPAGLYYRRLVGSSWSEAKLIYPSNYFRSLVPEGGNIHLATSDVDNIVNVYIAWDDRSQRRIFLAKSPDGGDLWDDIFQISGPEDFSGLEMPYNANLSIVDNQILLIWQVGVPGSECIQYGQWSADGIKQLGQPVKMLDEFALCPQSSQFVLSNKDYSVVLFNTFTDVSLMAWNGSNWSEQQAQNDLASFINPVTFDSVFLGCQEASSYKGRVYVVGCDTGIGRDIWFSSRSIDSIDEWFPPPSVWHRPVVVTNTEQKISAITSVLDENNIIHNLWIQRSRLVEDKGKAKIQYSRWIGENWSSPATIISNLRGNPTQLTASTDGLGKLLLAWVDDANGDMFFSWAKASLASSASEWKKPIYIPSVSQANSSPFILTDATGRMIVSYAVSINEERGIYIVETEDTGTTWSQPYRIFDASAAGWEVVDRPSIALTGDGRLHMIFGRYSIWGEQRRSLGLYYAQSVDGGTTWSEPEMMSDQPILWSEMVGYGELNLHRIWQEQRSSTVVSMHQFSSDGGVTWNTPATLSTMSNNIVSNDVAKDPFGNLYFLQLADGGEPSVLTQSWDGSGWKSQQPKVLDIRAQSVQLPSIVANFTSNGTLLVSILVESSDLNAEWQSEIWSMAQFLEVTENIPPSYPALIATSSIPAGTQEVLDIFETPTPSSSLAGTQTSQSFLFWNKNTVGFVLIGGILTLMTLVLWSSSKSKGKDK